MTCEVLRLLFDYYREKTWEPCSVRFPSFFLKMAEICATPIKALCRKAFRFDGLITPTLKAAGSNPVGHTTSEQAAYRLLRLFLQKSQSALIPLLLLFPPQNFAVGAL